jgi:acetylornithine/succinyldiaminopimelate/putrescine aminotransferase
LNWLGQELARGDVAGLILEPIQGFDVLALDREFLAGAERLCREHGTTLIVDEVFVGLGRTGRLFACEHFNLKPDMMILSKALSGGVMPIGALMMSETIHEQMFRRAGEVVHSSTFGLNDFGMAAGLATLQALEAEDLVVNAALQGRRLMEGLLQLKARYDMLADVRGWGLLIGLELRAPRSLTSRFSGKLLEKRGLLGHMMVMQLLAKHRVMSTNLGRNNMFRLTPPLTIGEDDVVYLLQAIESVLQDAYRFPDGISRFLLSQLLGMARGR